jgi:hypothetical protein
MNGQHENGQEDSHTSDAAENARPTTGMVVELATRLCGIISPAETNKKKGTHKAGDGYDQFLHDEPAMFIRLVQQRLAI